MTGPTSAEALQRTRALAAGAHRRTLMAADRAALAAVLVDAGDTPATLDHTGRPVFNSPSGFVIVSSESDWSATGGEHRMKIVHHVAIGHTASDGIAFRADMVAHYHAHAEAAGYTRHTAPGPWAWLDTSFTAPTTAQRAFADRARAILAAVPLTDDTDRAVIAEPDGTLTLRLYTGGTDYLATGATALAENVTALAAAGWTITALPVDFSTRATITPPGVAA